MEDNDVSLQLDGEKNGMEDKAKLWSGRLREKGSQHEDWETKKKHLKSVVRQWHFSRVSRKLEAWSIIFV